MRCDEREVEGHLASLDIERRKRRRSVGVLECPEQSTFEGVWRGWTDQDLVERHDGRLVAIGICKT
jgi:hypothetical protein